MNIKHNYKTTNNNTLMTNFKTCFQESIILKKYFFTVSLEYLNKSRKIE